MDDTGTPIPRDLDIAIVAPTPTASLLPARTQHAVMSPWGDDEDALTRAVSEGDYEVILAHPLLGLEFASLGGRPFSDIALDIMRQAPEELLARYPLSAMRLTYYLFNATNFRGYDHALLRTRSIVAASRDRVLQGEWLLLAALSDYPDAAKMRGYYVQAAELLLEPSTLFTRGVPSMFGHPSMWGTFYNEAGRGDEIADEITAMIDAYAPLTDGHGRGADVLYRGELASMRGDLGEAKALATEAAGLAKEFQQVSIWHGVALLLGRIAIARVDVNGLQESLDFLESDADGLDHLRDTQVGETLHKLVLGVLRAMVDEVPYDAVPRVQSHHHVGLALATLPLLHSSVVDMLAHGECEQAIETMDAVLQQGRQVANVVTRLYLHVGRALAYGALGRGDDAAVAMIDAVTLAEPDGLVATFVTYRDHLRPLLEHPMVRAGHVAFVERVLSHTPEPLPCGLGEAATSVVDALTNRERQVAKLACAGLTNREIGERLHLSEFTVKNHLQRIFAKVGVRRRMQLVGLLG